MCGNVLGVSVLRPDGKYLIFIVCDINQIKLVEFLEAL